MENSLRDTKAMFVMQQAFAIASTIVSAHLAAAETTADITLPFVGKYQQRLQSLGFDMLKQQ
ncbi:hypothetical protein [Acinetobacter baumannii]|uniref:hypothetical protein n=1 Tax=Acinetobacter baumannii TaxID=470 RepID=UPI001D18AABD|nr:hypothetical protein [Acinetobacter baumannii]